MGRNTGDRIKNFCVFALPGIFMFFVVVIIPFIYGFYLTFTDWDGVASTKNIVWFSNYAELFKDAEFWSSMWLTLKYVVCSVVLVNLVAFLFAYMLTSGLKGQNFFRTGFFTPNLIGGVVLGFIWQFVFSRILVNVGEATGWGIFSTSWLSDPTKAFWALVVVTVWQLSGYMMLIYVAGFTGMSTDVLEAASIDGATGFERMKSIIMPLMVPSFVICLFLTLSRAFMVYDVNLTLTGGEPFARKGFADFLERLRAAHPALDIRVTTNGTLIGPHIQTLKAIGLNAVNLSLDTFDRDKFEQITGRDLFGKVRENMDALLDAGIPFKLNAVAMRGFNDDELPAFIDYAMRHPIDVRFIEFMPMGEGTRWSDSCFWSAPDILDAVKGLVAVAPVEQEQRNGGPARLYTLSGPDGPGLGRLGLISPLSSHFCTSCNRLRITSDGALRTCLFDDREYRLRNALRHPKLGIEAVRRIVTLATRDKPIGARLLERRHNAVAQRRMTAIGG